MNTEMKSGFTTWNELYAEMGETKCVGHFQTKILIAEMIFQTRSSTDAESTKGAGSGDSLDAWGRIYDRNERNGRI